MSIFKDDGILLGEKFDIGASGTEFVVMEDFVA
jgi:hypothetical protein